MNRKDYILAAKRIVIKIGSAVLAGLHGEGVDEGVFANIAHDISSLKKDGKEVKQKTERYRIYHSPLK